MILAVCPNPAIDTLIYLDDIKKGRVNRIRKEQSFPGGKGVHVGMGVKELGHDVVVLGIWGGMTGVWIKEALVEKGIQCIGPNVETWTRVCQTVKSKSEFDETEILGLGPEISDDEFNLFMDHFKTMLSEVDVISLSGSWPPGAPDNAYAQMIALAKRYQIPTVLDCTGVQFNNAKKMHPTACHINYAEAKSITGKGIIEDQIMSLKSFFDFPLITKGAEGLYFSMNDKLIWSKVKIPEVLTAVGSGDAVTAGLVVGLKNNYSLEKIAKLTVSCGAANCIRAELGLFYKEDVNQLMNNVMIKNY